MGDQVDDNYQAFKKLLPGLLPIRRNQFALMHDQKIITFFDTFRDAVTAGNLHYGPRNFSVQEVTDKPEFAY